MVSNELKILKSQKQPTKVYKQDACVKALERVLVIFEEGKFCSKDISSGLVGATAAQIASGQYAYKVLWLLSLNFEILVDDFDV